MGAIIYLLQVSACTGIFYLFYYLMLSRLTFFTINRWYLLGTLCLSFVIPLLTITIRPDTTPVIKQVVYINQLQNAEPQVVSPQQVVANPVNWIYILKAVYLVAVACLFIKLMIMLVMFFVRIRNKHRSCIGSIHIVHNADKLNNGSFLNYIFLNEDELSEDEIRQIIEHEMLHVKLLHSVDRVLAKLAQIALWFNPFVYLYTRAIEENHEFEVDREIGLLNDKSKYADMLLHLSVARQGTLYNSFSVVPLKKRIVMLFTKPSNYMKKVIYVLVLPLLTLSCLAFARLKNDAPLVTKDKPVKPDSSKAIVATITKNNKVVGVVTLPADTNKKKIKSASVKPNKVISIVKPNNIVSIDEPFLERTHIQYADGRKHDKVTFHLFDGSASAELGTDDIIAAFIDGVFYDEKALQELPTKKIRTLIISTEGFEGKKVPDGPYAIPFIFKTRTTPKPVVKPVDGKVGKISQPVKATQLKGIDSIDHWAVVREIGKRFKYPEFYKRIQFNVDSKDYDVVVCTIGTSIVSQVVKLNAKTGLLIDGVFYNEDEIKFLPETKTKKLEVWREGLDSKKVPSGYIAALSLKTKTGNN